MISRSMLFDYYSENPPASIGAAYQFLYGLVAHGIFFPLDADPETIIDDTTGERVFSSGECWQMRVIFTAILEAIERSESFTGDIVALGAMLPGSCLDGSDHIPFFPKWGFSCLTGSKRKYSGWSQPGRWDGGVSPVFSRDVALEILVDHGEAFSCVSSDMDTAIHAVRLSAPDASPVALQGIEIRTSDGVMVVYDLAPLGLTFCSDECQEDDAESWDGF